MLALAGNCIYGTIPEEIGQLDNLLSLELHENGLVRKRLMTFIDAFAVSVILIYLSHFLIFFRVGSCHRRFTNCKSCSC
jgi:hypothetical protein